MRRLVSLLAAAGTWLAAGAVLAATAVPGSSNPKLAGMPDGTTASLGDLAPAQSPVLFTALPIVAGQWLRFAATGAVDHCSGGCPGFTPDGGQLWSNGAENGISGLTANIDALVGVFLASGLPSAGAAPVSLDFSGGGLGTDFLQLQPALQQVFFIGDGSTGGGAVQQFQVPMGATRLFLATHDGYGWANNSGVIQVELTAAVPEPAAWVLMLAGTGLLAGLARRRRPA